MENSKLLHANLKNVLSLPDPACEWLIMLWGAIQLFDDVADGDPIDREDLNAVIWNTLIGMNQNSFWITNSITLAPVIATMVLKWQGSDKAERSGKADARSYVWRAGYYDVVMMVVALCHGTKYATDNAHLVMSLYGEKLEDYLREFNNA